MNPKVPTYGYMDFDSYSQDLHACRSAFPNLKILKGIELCEPHLYLEAFQSVESREMFDCIIGAVHNVNNEKLRSTLTKYKTSVALQQYFEEVRMMIQTASIDVLAHIDLIKRYYGQPLSQLQYTGLQPIIDDILKTLIKRSIALEVNTSTFGTLHEIMPSQTILLHYYALGGRLITIGSDAHTPDVVHQHIEEAFTLLKEIGYTHVCYYEKRQPVWLSLC